MKNNFVTQLVLLVLLHLVNRTAWAETVNVEVVYPKISQQTESLILIGTVEAPQSAALAPLQPGLVAKLAIEKGQKVKEGQTLMVLDSLLAELSVQQAQAGLQAAAATQQEAERLYQELLQLSTQQLVAETLIAERKAALTIATAGVRQAKTQYRLQQSILSRHTLKAPFSGLIVDRYVNIGEWVTQQNPIFHLVSQDSLRLTVSIPQEYYQTLNTSQNISVKVTPDFNASSINATLDVLVNSAANVSRTLVGLITLPDEHDWLVGMSARVEISLPFSAQPIAWLPKSAIKQHPDGGNSVFTVVGNKAKQTAISVIQYEGALVAVSGITDEYPVVASGVAVLKNDAQLTVAAELSL